MPQKTNASNKSVPLLVLKTLSAAILSTVLSSTVSAAGLGKLTVLSALGRPLYAEIELTAVSKDEATSLSAKLASIEAFRQADVELDPALLSLRFAIEQRGVHHFIRITSAQPIHEPFVEMLVELRGEKVRMVRAYTFLLDPMELNNAQLPQGDAAVNVSESNATSSQRSVESVEPVRSAVLNEKMEQAEKPAQSVTAIQQKTGYRVRAGDTLLAIAARVKPEGVSLDQMLVGLYLANQNAFIDSNMNRLRAASVLTLPDIRTVQSVGNVKAKEIILAQQTPDFQHTRGQAVARVIPQQSIEPEKSISKKVEERSSAVTASKDKLTLLTTDSDLRADDGIEKATGFGVKNLAKQKALEEANTRLKELEKNISDLQKALGILNKNMTDSQKNADSIKADAISVEGSIAPKMPALLPDSAAMNMDSVATVSAKTPLSEANSQPHSDQPAGLPTIGSAAAASQPVSNPVARPTPLKKPVPRPKPVVVQTSITDTLLDNPLTLPGAGLVLALLGAMGIYVGRRKKSGKAQESAVADPNQKADSPSGLTDGQSVGANNSTFNASFVPSVSQLGSNEVDLVAEADVYIAYGRDAQAEEILKEALRLQPEHHAVRVKLLEIYAGRKDAQAFETLASELYRLTKGNSAEWSHVAMLGMALDPENPLYVGSRPEEFPSFDADTDDAVTAAALPSAQPQPETHADAIEMETLDLDTEDVAENSAPSDLQLDTSISSHRNADAPSASLSDLDFDLEELDIQGVISEQDANPKRETAAESQTAVPMPEIPAIPDEAANAEELAEMPIAASAVADSLDFDLSSISMELDTLMQKTKASTTSEAP